jgi:hypothetical protein
MANRTVRFLGQGYGATPATITVAVNGNVVFSGSVPTLDQAGPGPTGLAYADQQVLCEYTGLAADFAGELPVTIQVTGGELVVFGEILANFASIVNKSTSTPDTSGADGFIRICTTSTAPVATEDTPNDERNTVTIDGEAATPPNPRPTGKFGTWFWPISVGSTFAFNVTVAQGRDY